ncbi:MAG TPA: SLC13 family permease [Steroidobacteraceae bacterium]|nr:SLC13 family permease [Steroidobacteraceae bacterium]
MPSNPALHSLPPAHLAAWLIAAAALAGVIVRPWRISEALWAVLGAIAMVALSLLSLRDAAAAVAKGSDVYLFLTGMMLLAALARREGLFAWLAAYAVRHARGSARRLFLLIYLVGIAVTALLSNDATAVVLTPAVYAAAKDAGAPPLPYLFICAFIANAASFVLPISNPANLVVYGAAMPSLRHWLLQFAAASAAAIVATYWALRFTQRAALRAKIAHTVGVPELGAGGRAAAAGIAATALLLSGASALAQPLGLPTFLAGAGTWFAIMAVRRAPPWAALREISWSILPLVAGLFIMVRGIENTGALAPLARALAAHAHASLGWTMLWAGALTAVASNLLNNLPLGLIAGGIASAAHLPAKLTGALLIGVDLGPNLSVTGSLATILWLLALRREGLRVGAWRFLLVGSIVMPLALAASFAIYMTLAGDFGILRADF